MSRAVGLAVLLLLFTGCSNQPSSGGVASTVRTTEPSAWLGSSRFGVVEQVSNDGTYSIFLIREDGFVAAKARAAIPAPDYGQYGAAGLVSTSEHNVYYLDAPAAVRRLEPNGMSTIVARLPVSPPSVARFAVSPNDRRIAVAILTYSTGPGLAINYDGMKLYVSDLTGENRVDIFSSPTVAEWPVTWRGNQLVIKVATPFVFSEGWGTPFRGYHLADSTNGDRIAALCPFNEGWAMGLPTAAGVLCERYDASAWLVDWTGADTRLGANPPNPVYVELEPGTRNYLLLNVNLDPHDLYVVSATGELRRLPGSAPGLGFLARGQLLLLVDQPRGMVVYDIETDSRRPVALLPLTFGNFSDFGTLVARLPGGL